MESSESPSRLEQAQTFRKGGSVALRNARATDLKPEAREYLDILRQDPKYQESRQAMMQDRWEMLAAKVPEFSPQAWETAGRVFSGVNNGVKAALLVEIARSTEPKTASGQGTYIAVDDLVDRFKDLFAKTELLEALSKHGDLKRIVTQYCQRSLCNVGLTAEEYNTEGELVGFGITEEGKKFGVPAALLTLALENRTDQSVYLILGKTESPATTRAPFSRTRIFDYIARHPTGLREADLITVLKIEPRRIMEALELFDALELVKYKALQNQTGETQLEYELTPAKNLDQAPNVAKMPRLQIAVIGVITKLSHDQKNRFSIAKVVDELPSEIKSNWNDRSLKEKVGEVLSGLTKEEFLLRVDDFRGGKKSSAIALMIKGRSLTINLIWPVLSVISGEPLTKEQQETVDEVGENLPAFAKKSAELYYPYSTSGKKRKTQENLRKSLKILAGSPESLTAKKLAQAVGLTARTIANHFQPNIEDSNLAVVKVDGQIFRVARETIKGVHYYKMAA